MCVRCNRGCEAVKRAPWHRTVRTEEERGPLDWNHSRTLHPLLKPGLNGGLAGLSWSDFKVGADKHGGALG